MKIRITTIILCSLAYLCHAQTTSTKRKANVDFDAYENPYQRLKHTVK
ncbi:hypothetical protein [Pedobacter terrae]|nr:hypothetical protein [Pedobacter terrae]